jgi:hypothetical protein
MALSEADRKANKRKASQKLYQKKKERRDAGHEDKEYDRKKEKSRVQQEKYRNDPEWRTRRLEYLRSEPYLKLNKDRCARWRKSPNGLAYHKKLVAERFETARDAWLEEWDALMASGADCDLTQADIDDLMEKDAATIAADVEVEVDKFLNEVQLEDGPCVGLTFAVRTNILACLANLRRLPVLLTVRLLSDRKHWVNLNLFGETEGTVFGCFPRFGSLVLTLFKFSL